MRLNGLSALITGATGTLGTALAHRFWQDGASLLLAGRSQSRLDVLVSSLQTRALQSVHTIAVDLTEHSATTQLADFVRSRVGGLDILVNNAAVQGPIGETWTTDARAWAEAVTADLLAPVDVCRRLLPLTPHRAARGKIINISGGGAAAPRPRFGAYAASKAALVRFSETLAMELAQAGLPVDVNCVAPGAMNSAMTRQTLAAGALRAGAGEVEAAQRLLDGTHEGVHRATDLIAFLASKASDGISGRLISAASDSWDDLPLHAGEIASSDIFTLRRIVPTDRGFSWGDR